MEGGRYKGTQGREARGEGRPAGVPARSRSAASERESPTRCQTSSSCRSRSEPARQWPSSSGMNTVFKMPVRTVGDYLKRWGMGPRKPVKRAYERSEPAVKKWLGKDYPPVHCAAEISSVAQPVIEPSLSAASSGFQILFSKGRSCLGIRLLPLPNDACNRDGSKSSIGDLHGPFGGTLRIYTNDDSRKVGERRVVLRARWKRG